jgi:hypothetical protein
VTSALRIFLLPLTATALLVCAFFYPVATLHADTIRVRHVEGVSHGFLVVHNAARQAIAYGEMFQRNVLQK